MPALKTSTIIRTSRNIKSFRSCRYATGSRQKHLDQGRVLFEEGRRICREVRWLSFGMKQRGCIHGATKGSVPFLQASSRRLGARYGLIELARIHLDARAG